MPNKYWNTDAAPEYYGAVKKERPASTAKSGTKPSVKAEPAKKGK